MNTKKLVFIILFTVLGALALQVKISNLAGSSANFTLFDAFAPIAGSFLGLGWGLLSVVAMQVVNLFLHGSFNLDLGSIIRLIPTMFAVIYFARKTKFSLVLPILAIAIFVSHPIGRTVWFYAMFWLIPILMYPMYNKSLLARSLGATFTAHAVGGALWVYAFNLPREVWLSLIPVVIIERSLFGLGIAINYEILQKLLTVIPDSDPESRTLDPESSSG